MPQRPPPQNAGRRAEVFMHITVCLATYKRSRLLRVLLRALSRQETEEEFNYSVVVVDNDSKESARSIVRARAERSDVPFRYEVEPVRNISLARNRCVSAAYGDLVVFIDDDELPPCNWLLQLYKSYVHYEADGVLGPVVPYYEGTPPEWLLRSGLAERTRLKTGARLTDVRLMRTGNLMLRRDLVHLKNPLFNPELGRIGGEDTEFFFHMLEKGRSFVWCNEAPVYEFVSKQRQTRQYVFKRACTRGVSAARRESLMSFATAKSVMALILYGIAAPGFLIAGPHVLMKYAVKFCDHLSKLLAHFGIKVVKERSF